MSSTPGASGALLGAARGVSDGETGLVEREGDLALFEAAVARGLAGEGSLVFVQGPAGIGKSGLLAACATRAAAAGLRVLSARCTELEGDHAHAVARQLFERALHDVPGEARDRLLAGPANHAARVLLSEDPTTGHTTPGDSDFAAMHGLYWLAANLAEEGPLMLVVDDAHWADAASLRFLNYLANRLAGLSLIILVASRSDDQAVDPALLQTLAAGASCVLALRTLSAAGCAAVVRRRMGASVAFVSACHDCSGGNPFLLHELLSAVAADAIAGDDAGATRVRQLSPKGVSRSVLLRLARLPAGAIEFARAVAVLGDQVELVDAAALAGVSIQHAGELSDALAGAGVLAAQVPLCFVHPVIFEVVVGDLGPGERTAMHARAAELLHARGAGADQVAAQLAASGPIGEPWAVEILRRVAHAATARGAPDVARRHLRRALREHHTASTRGAVLAELGEVGWLCGDDAAAAIADLREARELTADPQVRAHATLLLARATISTGDVNAAAGELERAIDGPDDLGPGGRLRLGAALGSIALMNLSLMPQVRERLSRFRDLAGDSTEELLMLCNVAVLEWHLGTAARTAALARRALADGRLLAAVGSDTFAFVQAVWVLHGADCLDEARAVCEAALADARARGSAYGFAVWCTVSAMTAARSGDVRECEAHARAALELAEIPPISRPALYAQLALALIERGELDEAQSALQQGGVGPYLPVLAHMNGGFHARALLRIAQGRDEEALADLREYGARQARCAVGNATVAWRVDAARVCLRLGSVDEARTLLDEHEQVAARWGTPAAAGIALHGRAAATDGQDQIALLERAAQLLAESPCRLDAARVLLDLGSALRRGGRRRDAQRRLAEAVALARTCGATALATRANDELGVLSARPRRLQFSGVDALTASERRIALMAADGLSSPQIAQALFVTAKTVENHLGHVYIKLAIKKRAELRAALAGAGAVSA